MITLVLFSLIGLLSYAFLTYGVQLRRRIDSSGDAAQVLRKAQYELERDLLRAPRGEIAMADVPDQLGGGGKSGRAIAFRTAMSPGTGQFCQKPDGTPFWQANIIYYLAVPSGHDGLVGQSCDGGAGPEGYDDRCPHKVLIRKVIDVDPPTAPDSPLADEEQPLTDLAQYLTQPATLDLSSMESEPSVVDVKLVAQPLLWFGARLNPSGMLPGEVEIDLRSVMLADAQKKVNLGSTPLADDPLALQQVFNVVPQN
jgi:hypothetical protein